MFSTRSPLSRRDLLRLSAAGVGVASASGWLKVLAADAAKNPARKRSCILLWLNGGPSTIDLWDLKTEHKNGGSSKAIDTAVSGIQISEHLPLVAKQMKDIAVVRSMTTKEADHQRAGVELRTGQRPSRAVDYPTLGSLVAKELEAATDTLPPFVSIGGNFIGDGPGFLGAKYAALTIGTPGDTTADLQVRDLDAPKGVSAEEADARLKLLREGQSEFAAAHPGAAVDNHRGASERAAALMRGQAQAAFDLGKEKDAVRDKYGRNQFGQGCLLARRLVEKGVPFVEVTLDGWDTHGDNFAQVKRLSGTLDTGFAALMADLKDRGLLATTTVVCMGEFGRTPRINQGGGRDHWPNSWATVIAGGGIKGGQVIGKTSADGMSIEDRPTTAADFLATVCLALGLDPAKENIAPNGRPIRLADKTAKPVKELIVG